MTQLLIQGEVVLAVGPFEMDAESIKAPDAIFPKHVIPGWSMADVELPSDFTVAGYAWDGVAVTAKPPVFIQPTVQEYTDAVQKHLDEAAKVRNYDNIVSACSYAGAPNPFQSEGVTFVQWRGDVWAMCYQIMAEVQAEFRAAPTIDALIAELPALVL